MLNLSVRPSQGSCFKGLYERSKRPHSFRTPFVEEQNAKLQSELRENHAKRVSVENQRRCSIKKSGLKNFAIFIGKHLYWSLFFKKRLQHRCFSVNTENGCFCFFKSNFVQFSHFNCLILFKDAKIQSFDLLLIILLYFLFVLISH